MILDQRDVEVTFIRWETTPDMKENGTYGLKDQIIRTYMISPKNLRIDIGSPDFLIIGEIYDNDKDDLQVSMVEALRLSGYISQDTIRACVYDLYRQGYIGQGYYIVEFNSPF